MISAPYFVELLIRKGFGPFLCVPCSYFKALISFILEKYPDKYMIANNEGEALSIASGLYLTGKMPVVLVQNSGIGNMFNPLTSLNYTFQIPVLLLISQRGGKQNGDQPQHQLIGEITKDVLDLIKVDNDFAPETENDLEQLVSRAAASLTMNKLPFALVIKKGLIEPYQREYLTNDTINKFTNNLWACTNEIVTFENIIEEIVRYVDDETIIVTTTGYTSRRLFFELDRSGNFYNVGSMGCASSIALGIAIGNKNKKVIVLDGDGAVLMRLEALVSIGHYSPDNIIHIVLDNESYESTGGQPTSSTSIKFDKMGGACGYKTSVSICNREMIHSELGRCMNDKGPHLLHLKMAKRKDSNIGRPTISPVKNKERIIEVLN